MTITAPVPGLSASDSKILTSTLLGDCDVRHQILTLSLSHKVVADILPMYLDGQINIVDADQNGITRTLQVGFLDPDHRLRLDSDAPTAGVGGMDRLLQIRTFVRSPSMGYWLGAPTFTGRPSVLGRNGDTITVQAQDKACLHLKGTSAYTIHKRTNVVAAIRSILARNGETRFRFPSGITKRMPTGVHVGGPDEDRQPWKVAWKLARSIGYQLYYDLDGWACLRRAPTGYSWELFEQGPRANCLSRVTVDTDLTSIRNRVVATGHTKHHKKGPKSRVLTSWAVPHSSHPLSGQRLAMNGTNWYNSIFYDEPDIHTQRELDRFAKARLVEILEQQTDVSTSTFPVWHLQGKDRIRLQTAGGDAVGFRLINASIPLGESEAGMTIGYHERVRRASAGRLRKAA